LRRYKDYHNFKAGEIIKGVFEDGLVILLKITKDTEIKTFADLTDEEAMEDGFSNAEDAFDGLKCWYPDLMEDDLMGVVRFEILTIDGEPVVRYTEPLEE
jgi:hypothetical protein